MPPTPFHLHHYLYDSDDEIVSNLETIPTSPPHQTATHKTGNMMSMEVDTSLMRPSTIAMNNSYPSIQINENIRSTDHYYEHIVMPTDTIQGICLKYKMKPMKLRQINKFSGNSLMFAPKKLLIPKRRELCNNMVLSTPIQPQDKTTKEYKIYYLLATFSFATKDVVKTYCELMNWDLNMVEESIRLDSKGSVCYGLENLKKGLKLRQARKTDSVNDEQISSNDCPDFIDDNDEGVTPQANHFQLKLHKLDFTMLNERNRKRFHGEDEDPFTALGLPDDLHPVKLGKKVIKTVHQHLDKSSRAETIEDIHSGKGDVVEMEMQDFSSHSK